MTYIYQTVTESMFHDAFERMGRKDQFSHEGRTALYEHLEELAYDAGEPFKFDVVGLCYDFTEYESIEEYNAEYETYFDSWRDVEGLAAEICNGGAIVHNL